MITAAGTSIKGTSNGAPGRLLTRQGREEALRRQDYEHKHTALAPSMDREGPQYPHVYKSHNAGNTLSSGGRKYALPVGSERKEHDVSHSQSLPCLDMGIDCCRNTKSIQYRQ